MIKGFLIALAMNMALGMGQTETYVFANYVTNTAYEVTYWTPCGQCSINVKKEVYNW